MTFDFQEALSYIKAGMYVSLKLDNIERVYYLKDYKIMCIPNRNKRLEYSVSSFYVDAVLSDNWQLVDEIV